MPARSEDTGSGSIEECIDDIDALIGRLNRYPPAVIAFALRTHLGGLLRALVESQVCSREQAREFVLDLEHEALGVD